MQKYTFSIGVFGACFDQGQPHAGVGDAPDLIRQGQTLIYSFKVLVYRQKNYAM